jgi:hypothetical protein
VALRQRSECRHQHIAIETDDYAGAPVLEERVNNGRHVFRAAAPAGAQMELIEKV